LGNTEIRFALSNRGTKLGRAGKKPFSMRLSPHFTLAQFLRSETAKKNEINNTPSAKAIKNLKILAVELEKVRALLKRPIVITSGYRCKALNTVVGGSETSQHMQGLAVDFLCKRYGSPYRICKRIAESDIEFDQLIHEYGISRSDQWIHLSFGPKKRRQVLTIWTAKGFYKKGLHRHPKK